MGKKYKLFSSAADDGGRRPCAFFFSDKGCRNGDTCKFAHEKASEHKDPFFSIDDDVSSESSDDEIPNQREKSNPLPYGGTMTKSNESSKKIEKKRKTKVENPDENPFADTSSKKAKNSEPLSSTYASLADLTPVYPKMDTRSPPKMDTCSPPKMDTRSPSPQEEEQAPPVQGFRALQLPIASSSVPNAKSERKKEKKSRKEAKKSQIPREESTTSHFSMPKSHPEGVKWSSIVKKTQQNERFPTDFDFDKYKDLDEDIGLGRRDWIKFKPYGRWCAENPQVVAIKCQMCETTDPVFLKKDTHALCRISVVDAVTDEVLLDSLVKPTWPVSDYRTSENGMSAEKFENVQFTLRHAQAFMMALCSEETIIIGHSVHNDLAAMRVEHTCVADSMKIFVCDNSKSAHDSLKVLAFQLFEKRVSQVHDSIADARLALQAAKYFMEKEKRQVSFSSSQATANQEGEVDDVSSPATENMEGGADADSTDHKQYHCRLFVHRIPKGVCNESHIFQMFVTNTDINPKEIEDIQYVGERGKTIVRFKSAAHANLAMKHLEGKFEIEASGRQQKRVYLRDGDYVYVRKMAFDSKKADKQKSKKS